METPGLEAPQRGNEGMANCTQTVHLLYTTPTLGEKKMAIGLLTFYYKQLELDIFDNL